MQQVKHAFGLTLSLILKFIRKIDKSNWLWVENPKFLIFILEIWEKNGFCWKFPNIFFGKWPKNILSSVLHGQVVISRRFFVSRAWYIHSQTLYVAPISRRIFCFLDPRRGRWRWWANLWLRVNWHCSWRNGMSRRWKRTALGHLRNSCSNLSDPDRGYKRGIFKISKTSRHALVGCWDASCSPSFNER